MNNPDRDVANNVSRDVASGKRIFAVTIVFLMISMAFVTLMAAGDEPSPEVWTSKDEYSPGETVIIYGEGFYRWVDVTIELDHPAFEATKTFTEKPDYYGRFVCDSYVAEWVSYEDPVNVTVTQVLGETTLVATTQFWDPAVYAEGFTLRPQARFTTGDIKGYNEGDSIPMILVLNEKHIGQETLTIQIGVDFMDHSAGTDPILGIDYLTEYWLENPTPPYNTYANSSQPFYVAPSEGAISNVYRMDNYYDAGAHKTIQVWSLDFEFDESASYATIRFGVHLALTNLAEGIYGASYYPGASLHVRLFEIIPAVADEGNRDVPIMTTTILTPPKMVLEKCCEPQEVVMGDVITFTIEWYNEGQANAYCVVLTDTMPWVVDLVPGSFLTWTSLDSDKLPPSVPPVVDGRDFRYDIGFWPGTGTDGGNPVVHGYLSFQATVNTNEEGVYRNWAFMNFSDDHGGEFPMLEAWCEFWIRGAPDIMVEKTGPEYAHPGDDITYTYTVTNVGPVALEYVNVTDDRLGIVARDTAYAVGDTRTYTMTYEDIPDTDPLVNTVTAVGTDYYNRTATDTATWEVDLLHPEITVTKTTREPCAAVGDDIIYTITVSNPSDDTDLYGVVVEDPLLGLEWDVGDLPGGASDSKIVTVTLTEEPEDDPLVNEVTAEGWDLLDYKVTDTASASVEIYHPMISVEKGADLTCAIVGETVTYWIKVTNPSWDTHMFVTVEDAMLFGSMDLGWLEPGGEWYDEFEYKIQGDDDDPLTNTVWAYANDEQGHHVSASDSHTVDIYHPMIELTKEADRTCTMVGETITYWLNVSNPSSDTPMDVTLSDPMFGGVVWTGTLLKGESHSEELHFDVVDPDLDPIVNVANVTATDPQGHTAYDEARWEVDVYHPGIEVDKWADKECAEIGEAVTFHIDVWNPSDDTRMYTVVDDPMFGGIIFEDWLAADGSVSFDFEHVVSAEDTDPLVNRVWVNATDPQDHPASAYDEVSIEIYHPAIEIVKYADKECAAVGETVKYTIVVTNPSGDTEMHAVVDDPMFGGIIWSGDLAPGASQTLRMPLLDYVIMPDDNDPLVNTAHVYATDPQDHVREAWDSWTIDVVHPDVDIVKTADLTCAGVGETVHYTITVVNPQTADVWLNGTAYDDLLGWSEDFTNLEPGMTITWELDFPMPDLDEFINTARVVAYDHQLHEVTAESSVRVDVVHPAIEVTKTADLTCAAVGETVEYTITVSVPADADVWMNGTVTDAMLDWSAGFEDLQPGQSTSWTVCHMITEGDDPLVNEVEVVAYDHQEHMVTDSDSWSVDVVHPGILVDKEADKECAEVGEDVNYRVTVSLPEYVDVWMNGTVYDSYDGENWAVIGTFSNLKPGDVYVIEYTHKVTENDADPMYNYVLVKAKDHQDHEVSARDMWRVDVVHPGIVVTKTAPEACAHLGETIWYTITVSVPEGTDVWMNGTVYDDELGWVESFFDVCLGNPASWEVPYVVTEETPDPFTNTVYVEAYDHQMHLREAWDSFTVDIFHPSIQVTKTGPEEAYVGEEITYTVVVTNTGDTPLYYVTLDDSLVGVIAYFDELGVDESQTVTYTYIVPPGEGTLDNTVWAEGVDGQRMWVYDEDSWSVYKYGMVYGQKTADLDRDGVFDEGEPTLSNWVIQLNGTLDAGGYDNRTMLTDGSGAYQFTGLLPGIYVVSEVMQPGWTHVTPMTYTVTVGSGSAFVRSFGNIPYGDISGHKWLDSDLDGVWDEGELPVEGWEINLIGEDIGGASVDLTVYTDADGYYVFADLMPGVYTVYETLVDGWFATTPVSVVLDVSAMEPFEIEGIDFGNARYGSITGFKWLDEYMNGYKDGNESMLPGWVIELTGVLANGTPFGPIYTETGENGYYAFDELMPGVYIVRELMPEGWYNVTPSWREVTIVEGSLVGCAKFGNVEYGSIDGWKFLDWDMDAMKDGDEPGIPGWKITLTGWLNDGDYPWAPSGATPVGPIDVYTDAEGRWVFPNLLPGIYRVTEESREYWYHTTVPSISFWILSGTEVIDVKFGNVPYTCLWGYKFEDVNGNGIWDEGEPGLPGWTIVVEGVRNDDVPVRMEIVTDEEGYWATCYNILPGEYRVYEVMQEGWVATTEDGYGVDLQMTMEPAAIRFDFGNFELGRIVGYKYEDMNGDGRLDEGDVPIAGWTIYLTGTMTSSTVTNEYGYFEFSGLVAGTYTVTEEDREGWVHTTAPSHTVTVLSGDCIELPVFLNVELGKIWGYKFEDLNSNGEWDEGEPGIPGWTIYMIWDGDATVYSTTTDEKGYYEFTGLMPAECMVWEEERSGWTPTTPISEIVEVRSGGSVRVHDFGNFHNVWIWVFKYEDVNSNGVYDEGDRPIEGWSVTVMGPGLPGGIATLVTGADGYASVEVTAAGVYTVEEEAREGWCPTTPPVVDVFVLSGCAEPELVMFGNFRCVTITLFKYEDVNSNGVYDDGDWPLEGWTFRLRSESGDSMTVTTDIDGYATITFCSADEWYIEEEMPGGWCPVNPASGSYLIWVESGYVYCYDLKAEMYYFEFGNFHCVEILVFKFWDKCSNGWYDPDGGDEPLEGWYFELFGPTGELIDYGWTDADGYLSFTVCAAGTYTLVEELQDGWSAIYPLGGSAEIDVKSGDGLILAYFANYLHVEVPVFKYEDVDSSGDYDPEIDRPVEGWYFELTRIDDGVTYSGYTDEHGMLVLEVNRSGMYLLVEEDREGWTHISPAGGKRSLTVTSGTEVPLLMFGNFRDVEIPVFKYEDVNGNGVYDEGDRPLAGWEFTVTGPWPGSGAVIVTGEDGYASVIVNRSGTYTVTEEDREGWTHTTAPTVDVYLESSYILKPLMFGNFRDVEITVFKYEDVNSNGVYDDGDRPLAGWEIWMYNYATGTYLSGYTDDDGYVTFVLTEAGMWDLWEFLPEGWCVITPEYGYYMVDSYSGAVYEPFEFGNFRCVEIEVFKYEDVDSDGVYDPEIDRVVEGWYFELLDASGAVVASGVTDETGHAWFLVCSAGEWTVVEERREGVTPINPADGMLTVETWSGAEPETLMFGNFWDVWIWVFKYEDVDSSGDYDPEIDRPLAGWEFTISGPGVTNAVALTGEDGYAGFLVDRAGTYTVTEEDREGWTHVNPASGSSEITVYSKSMTIPLMFGNFWDVTIIVFKFDDKMADGRYDPEDDKPIEGWYFELYFYDGEEWVLVDHGYTDADGYLEFVVTHAGLYMVCEEDREGWIWILPGSGYYEFGVTSGMEPIELWFANFKLGKIYGYKWNDLNGNGEWDEGEPGLEGWKIWYECVYGPYYLTQFTYTDENGYYEFTGLPTGHYLVWEVMQASWVNTSPAEVEVDIIGHTEARVDFLNFELGCIEGYKYEDMDSDGVYDPEVDKPIEGWIIYLSITTGIVETPEGPISAIALIATTTTDADGYYSFCGLGPGMYVVSEESRTGWTHTTDSSETVVMTSGATIRIHDFLNYELGSICGYKFEDLNSNGIWDEGEPALPGWEIRMMQNGYPEVEVTYTGPDGRFCFDGLMSDEYIVWEHLPDGWINTTPLSAYTEIYSGDDVCLEPFGNFELVDIDLFKYEDVDGDGFYDNGDVPIEGWMFTVEGPCFGTPLVVYTDDTGHAQVTISEAGTYLVKEEDREGWMHVNPEDGEMMLEVHSGSVFKELRFGNFLLGQITGYKFYDSNLNGLKDEGEIGLANWVIWINGTLVGGGHLDVTRLTDSNGYYSVSGLPAGTYTVSERLEYAPAGWMPTTPTTIVVGVYSGTVASASFANAVFGVIEGHKFYDKNLDGYMDEGEPGLAGWTIILEGFTDQGLHVYRTVLTDGTGHYMFDLVQPGSYTVTEVLPGNWAPTTTLPVVVDISGTMVYFDIWVNIGNVRYATVFGYKFLDTYGEEYPYWPNGVFDEYEHGLGNWEITLQGWDNLGQYVDRVAYTDNLEDVGYYAFGELLPGTYWVNETLLFGYAATKPVSNLVIIYPFPLGPVVIRIDFGNLLPDLDPEIPFTLNAGWNLWSSPLVMHDAFHASDLAEAIGPACQTIYRLDPDTKKYEGYLANLALGVDFEIETGVGYYVFVMEDVYFTLTGDLTPTSTVELAESWNLVGFNQLKPMRASELAERVSGCTVVTISYLDESGKYHTYMPALFEAGSVYDFTLSEGRAYFVFTDGAGSLVFG